METQGGVMIALSNSPLGLLTTGAEALRLLTEVVARRAAWRRDEERLGDAAEAVPGAVIRLKAGERAPLAATVVEGTGTAIDRDGTPLSVGPECTISAGARLQGGRSWWSCMAREPSSRGHAPRPQPPRSRIAIRRRWDRSRLPMPRGRP